jgi:hypothetical protein
MSYVFEYENALDLSLCDSIVKNILTLVSNKSIFLTEISNEELEISNEEFKKIYNHSRGVDRPLTPWENDEAFSINQLNSLLREELNNYSELTVGKLISEKFNTHKNVYPCLQSLYYYRTGTAIDAHLDGRVTSNTSKVFSSVTYLNDNFTGGETVFHLPNNQFQTVIPKKGKLVIFNGGEYYHHVNEVTAGIRCSINMWYNDTTNLLPPYEAVWKNV